MREPVSTDVPPKISLPQIIGYVGSIPIWGLVFLCDDPSEPGRSFLFGCFIGILLGFPMPRLFELAEEFTIGLRWPYWTHHVVMVGVCSVVTAAVAIARDEALSIQWILSFWLTLLFACAPYALVSSFTRWRMRQRLQRNAEAVTEIGARQ